MKLSEAVEEFAEFIRSEAARTTAISYTTHARRLAKWMGPQANVSDFTVPKARAFMEEITEGLSAGSRYVYIGCLRKFGDFLKLKRYLRGPNPARALKLPRVKSRPRGEITDAEIQALFAATCRLKCPYRATLARCVLALLSYTGLRCCELLALNVEHLRLNENLIYVEKGKGNKEGYVAINAECQQALCALLTARTELAQKAKRQFLHPGLLAMTPNQRIHRFYLNSLLDELTLLAELKPKQPFRAHAFRHALANRLDKHGASLNDIKNALRHEKITTTEVYLQAGGIERRLVGAGRPNGNAIHRGGSQTALRHDPTKEGAQMPVIGVDSAWADRPGLVGIAPASAWLLVAVREVSQELTQFVGIANGEIFLPQKPQQLLDDVAPCFQGTTGMLPNIAREEPSLGVALQFGEAKRRVRFRKTRR